jgi:hypothetical protein
VIYEYGEPWWNDNDRGKLLTRPPELFRNPGSKRKERAKEMIIWPCEVFLFILTSGFYMP